MNTRLSRQFLRVTLPLIACLLAAAAARADDPPRMDLNLAFSLDGGKTYSSDFPFLPAPGTLKVRVTWSNPRPPNETEVYTTALYSEQADFASANVGKQTWSGFPAWYQRPRVYWAGPKATSFVYDLDLRARPADTIGYDNVWDAKANRRANGPLPACEALANGTWKFTVRVGYPLKHTPPKKQVEGTADFFVTIGQTAPATAKAAPAAAPAAPKAAFDETPPELGRGDAEWSIAEAESIGTAPKAPTQQGDVLLLPAKQELRWIVSNAAPGSVYVGIVLSSEAGRMFTPGTVYVDGEPVRFLSTRTPGRMGSSWVAEYLAETPLPVRAGSEVRVVAPQAAPVTVGRLAFYRTAPERGPIDVRHTPEPAAEDTLRITTALQVGPERDRAGTATFAVENVLTHPLKAVVRARVLDHFQQIVTQFSNSVVLAPRVPFEQTLSFTWGASERYRLAVDVDTNDGHHAAGVAEAAADALEPMRGKVWLSGAWEFTGLGDAIQLAPPAEDAKWEPVHVPGRSPNSVRNGEHCGWFRRTFTVPDWLPGERRILVVERANYEGTVVLNGRELGRHLGWQAGFELDVTDALRPGTNELLIGVRDGIAALTPEEQARGGAPSVTRKMLWPAPTDRAGLGDVYLRSEPVSRVESVFTRPSFRKRTLTLEIECAGLPPGTCTVHNTVFFEGRPVLQFDDAAVPADGRLTLSREWADPILWGLGQPNLLRLDTELRDAAGRRLDLRQTRFGFRELWAEGPDLIFNGVPMHFRAYAMNDDWGWNDRMQWADIRRRVREGQRFLGMMERHIYSWNQHPTVADEEGIPIAYGVTGEHGPTQYKLESDELWIHTVELATQAVRRLYNHPSILQWYINNEYSECAPDAALATRRQVQVRDAIVAVDPSRIIEAGCDLDLRGALDIISTHYPVDIGGLRDPRAYLPDAALWRQPGTMLKPGQRVPAGQVQRVANVHGTTPFVWGVKPIIINETGWVLFYAPPFGFAIFLGDDIFRSPEMSERGHLEANSWFMAGHRDAGASLITPWHHHFSGAIAHTLPPEDVFPFTRHTRWYGGTAVDWEVDVFHDNGINETLRFAWTLQDTRGRPIRRGGARLQLEGYDLSRQRVAFKVPSASSDRDAKLVLELRDAGGGPRAQRSFAARIAAPVRASLPKACRAALFDPDGRTAEALKRLGVEVEDLNDPAPRALAGFDLLIIGEEAAPRLAEHDRWQDVAKFVEEGGRLLCLRQNELDPVWFGVGRPAGDTISSFAFRRAPHHPALRNLPDDELQFWYPDHVVVRSPFSKPAGGHVQTLIDCANGTVGLELAAVVERRLGRGAAVFSQCVFAERPGQCPQADRLVADLLGYLAEPVPAALSVGARLRNGSPLSSALRTLGAQYIPLQKPADLAGISTLLAEPDIEWTPEWIAATRTWLAKGGRLLLHGVGPDDRALVAALADTSVLFLRPDTPGFAGRMILFANDPLTDGLSNQDVFWRRMPEGENTTVTYNHPDFLVGEVASSAYAGDRVVALSYPAALARVNVGRGALYLDGVRWDAAPGAYRRSGERIGGTFLFNLGVEVQPPAPRARLKGLTWTPLDIQRFFNRALADEKAEDGKGGWSDQGPDADMRTMPTGRQTFAGTLFDLPAPGGCIVLASMYRAAGPPGAVMGIPVGRRAAALAFLHSGAWIGRGLHATYRIHYADGQTTDIPLLGDINFRDWSARNAAEPFPLETDTYTQAGWTGSSKLFPTVSVYVMEWANPRPDVQIESFDFISATNGVPILLAVSTGALPAPAAATAPADSAKAKALDEQARAALQAGERDKAVAHLRAALAADPGWYPARLRLADLLEEAGQKQEAERELLEAVRLNPQLLEIYLRIGELREAGGRLDEAIEIYRRSLQVNPNQPPVLKALEDAIKKQKGAQ